MYKMCFLCQHLSHIALPNLPCFPGIEWKLQSCWQPLTRFGYKKWRTARVCVQRPYKDFNESHNFKYVIISLCNKTADGRHSEFKKAMKESYELTREQLIVLSCLLDELIANNCISFQETFDHYAGKIPSLAFRPDKKEARWQFKEKILSKNGLPVLFLNNGGRTFVMLLEMPLNNIPLCRNLDQVLPPPPHIRWRAHGWTFCIAS